MTDIKFSEDEQYQPAYQVAKKQFLVRLVLSTGIVTNDEAAEKVLLGVAILFFILSLFFFFGGFSMF